MFATISDGNENCDLLGYYAARNGNSLSKFRDSLSVKNQHYSLRNSPEEHGSHLPRGGRLKSAGNLRYSEEKDTNVQYRHFDTKKNWVSGLSRP
jgi:hypothetical protein